MSNARSILLFPDEQEQNSISPASTVSSPAGVTRSSLSLERVGIIRQCLLDGTPFHGYEVTATDYANELRILRRGNMAKAALDACDLDSATYWQGRMCEAIQARSSGLVAAMEREGDSVGWFASDEARAMGHV